MFRRQENELRFLLIHDRHGNWGLPKGHVETGESALSAAVREIAEETSMHELRYVDDLGVREWCFDRDDGTIRKLCRFFVFEAQSGTPRPQIEEGISQAEFLTAAQAARRATFDMTRELVAETIQRLQQLAGSRSS